MPHIMVGSLVCVDVAVLVAVLVAVIVALLVALAVAVSLVITTGSTILIVVTLVVADSKAEAVVDSKEAPVADADAVADISGISATVLVPVNSSEFITRLSTFTRIL
jgi:hypothetical protein